MNKNLKTEKKSSTPVIRHCWLVGLAILALPLAGCTAAAPAPTPTVQHTAKPREGLFPLLAKKGSKEETFLTDLRTTNGGTLDTGDAQLFLKWAQIYCTGHVRHEATAAADASVTISGPSNAEDVVRLAADTDLCPGVVAADPPTAAQKKAAARKALHDKRANETYIFVHSTSGEAGNITYGIDGDQQQDTNVSLPWRHRVTADVERDAIIVVVAQNAGGGAITCGYEDGNGKTWNTSTSHGQYAVVTCS